MFLRKHFEDGTEKCRVPFPKIQKRTNLRIRKFHFLKNKELFWRWIFFYYCKLGLKSTPGTLYIATVVTEMYFKELGYQSVKLTKFTLKLHVSLNH